MTNIPQAQQAISLNFIGDTMFVSGVDGVQSYDVSNPRDPQLLGVLPMYIWENEDVDVDPARHLLFISRDPRGFTSPATSGATFPYGMLQVIDVSNPRAMIEISQIVLGSGHTSTCVAKCRWIWTGGPFANAQTQPSWHGRPIMSTDLSDPMNPKACPHPINLGNNDGLTDYSHDVQVDAAGVAWVSGFGSVRGFWVTGRHRDPVDGRVKTATGCDPIPYAGGGTELGRGGGIMHNAGRNLQAKVDGRRGDVLWVTEENLTTACATTGRFSTYDLRGSYQGQGFKNIAKTKFRLKQLGTWSIEKQPGSNGCDSAHYFSDRGDQVLAYAFYGQGTRFLDVSNPRRPRQVGYFRPDDASTWAPYWHKGYVFIADRARGIDIVRFTGKGGGRSSTVVAPPLDRRTPVRFTASPTRLGWMCAVPA
ncbi:MAG: LVIVD repeat-containing protein [Mycobacteriales bacterium]